MRENGSLRASTSFATLAAAPAALLLLSNWPSYQYGVLEGPLALYYYAVPLVLAAAVAATRPSVAIGIIDEPLAGWFVVYVVAGLVWLLFSGTYFEGETRQWRLRVLALLVFAAAWILARAAHRPSLGAIVLGCAALAAVGNWLDVLFPFRFVPAGHEASNPGRGAGLFMNANQAGTAVIAMVIAALPSLPLRWRGPSLLLMLLAVAPTFSRSALLCAGLVLALCAALRLVNRKQLLLVLALVPAIIAGLWAMHDNAAGSGEINLRNLEQRIEFFTDGDAYDDSAEERRYVASIASQMIAEHPLLGNGIASTVAEGYGRGTHNMYLMLTAEQGLVGAMLYGTLLALLVSRGWTAFRRGATRAAQESGAALLLMGAFFAFIGLFSHNLLEEPSTMFVLAFVASASSPRRVIAGSAGSNCAPSANG
jgi:O-antigen ligase